MSYDRDNAGTRGVDGLNPSSTTDAYGDDRGGNSYRSNDGLDATGISDASNKYSSGRDTTRGYDGLSTQNTYGADSGNSAGDYTRTNDGLDPSGTSDARRGGATQRGGNPAYNDRTSGGLGLDDTMGDNERTGGAERGGDQEKSQYTSGGLGQNDTYGDEKETGGNDTGYDHNYGMGTGRTHQQETGGPLPTEPGRTDDERNVVDYSDPRSRRGDDDNDNDDYNKGDNRGSSQKDSTTGKLMEKAGGMFKNEGLREKGEQKRREAGNYD